MSNGIFGVPVPRNESVLAFTPGSPERKALGAELDRMAGQAVEITPRIGGRRITTGRTMDIVMPHDHRHVLAVGHKASAAEGQRAIDAAAAAPPDWARVPRHARAAIFLRAAGLPARPAPRELHP